MHDPEPYSDRKTILLVAKDSGLRVLLKATLEAGGGYRVFAAPSVGSAVGYATSCSPDLLVYMMDSAQQSTTRALAGVQRHAPLAALPLLVVGGDGSTEPWPGAEYLAYPFRIDVLLATMAGIVTRVDTVASSHPARASA
jgi:DNA-binding NtrC family response regulator